MRELSNVWYDMSLDAHYAAYIGRANCRFHKAATIMFALKFDYRSWCKYLILRGSLHFGFFRHHQMISTRKNWLGNGVRLC